MLCVFVVSCSGTGEQNATSGFGSSSSGSSSTLGAGGAGGTTSGGGSAGSGSGGSAPVCSPEGPFDGEPVVAPPDEWTWVPVPGAICREGGETGFGVRMNPSSDKLFIYLEGGGGCFNQLTCVHNSGSYSTSKFELWKTGEGNIGIFDSKNAANQMRDWNAVYVPYCTGDIHAGNATGIDVPGALAPKQQSFVGYKNLGLFLKRIIPSFPNVKEVVLTGISAGGFASFYNYDRVAQAFCPKPVILIDDSGPPMSDTYISPCLQTRFRTLWGLNSTLPKDCPECTGPDGGGLVNMVTFLKDKYAKGRLGLISADKDSVVSIFYGFGKNNCALIDVAETPLLATEFMAGLAEVRDVYMAGSSTWSTYYESNVTHTYLGLPTFYTTTVKGVKLTNWVGTMATTGAAGDIAP